MKAKLETTPTGEHFAIIKKEQFIDRPGDCRMIRLPDIRLPVTFNADGTLAFPCGNKLRVADGSDWQRADTLRLCVCTECKTKYIGTIRGRYCSVECIDKAARRNAKWKRRKKAVPCLCQSCGAEITGRRITRKFCSDACRQRAHRHSKTNPQVMGDFLP